jgi:hypothetical protein
MSQKQLILKHLEDGKSLTPLDALSLFGCFRLAARINDLRTAGHKINTTNLDVNGKKIASYSMELLK